MSNIEALKEQARRHEQQEEWQKACDLYLRAIDRLDEDEQPDIGLHNRVGDLLIRLGDYEKAVQHFERATDLYLDAELHNNAIAVCKKVLRHLPTRTETYLRIGKIRASQGFLVDARENFLVYAERMQAAGDTEEALRALVEFVELAPEDTELRTSVAAQLVQHGRPDDALDQLVAGYRVLVARGDGEAAAALIDKIRELDPEADPADLAVPATDPDALAFEATALGSLEEAGLGAQFGEVALPEEGAEAGAPSPASEPPSGHSDRAVPLGDRGDVIGDFSEISLGDEVVDLPFLTDEEGMVDEEPEPLPFLSLDDGAQDDAAPDGSAAEPPSLGEGTSSPPHPMETGPDLEGEAAAGRLSARERWVALRDQVRLDPAALESCQELVEVAFQLEDQAALVESYLALAAALRSTGEGERSSAVLRQVLALNPEHPEARAMLDAGSAGGSGHPPPAPGGGFVDLGALVFEDDQEPRTTRFRVAYEEPTGDEAADFARTLSQFKAKVAESFDYADVKAHHDLGTAYKEMGLLDEALEKFQQALRAAPGHLPTLELLGQTFMERGEYPAAVRALERALAIPVRVDDELIGIYYYLARAYEELGRVDQAIEFYDRVFALDINFADVTERLRSLR